MAYIKNIIYNIILFIYRVFIGFRVRIGFESGSGFRIGYRFGTHEIQIQIQTFSGLKNKSKSKSKSKISGSVNPKFRISDRVSIGSDYFAIPRPHPT